MQVLVVGSIQVDAAQRDALLEAIRPHVARTRAEEPGCLDYAFTADTVEPDRVVVLERWADEAALAAHFSHPSMTAVKSALRANGSGASDILKYRVDRSESVRDETGAYRASFAAR